MSSDVDKSAASKKRRSQVTACADIRVIMEVKNSLQSAIDEPCEMVNDLLHIYWLYKNFKVY